MPSKWTPEQRRQQYQSRRARMAAAGEQLFTKPRACPRHGEGDHMKLYASGWQCLTCANEKARERAERARASGAPLRHKTPKAVLRAEADAEAALAELQAWMTEARAGL
jgi:hypothetical protein